MGYSEIVQVENVDWWEDQLTVNEANLQAFLTKIEKITTEEKVTKIEAELRKNINNINSSMDSLLDISAIDFSWEINAKDWSKEEYNSVLFLAETLNKRLEQYISDEDYATETLLSDLDNLHIEVLIPKDIIIKIENFVKEQEKKHKEGKNKDDGRMKALANLWNIAKYSRRSKSIN